MVTHHGGELHHTHPVDAEVDDPGGLAGDRGSPLRRMVELVLDQLGPAHIVADVRRERIADHGDPVLIRRLALRIFELRYVPVTIGAPMAVPGSAALSHEVC